MTDELMACLVISWLAGDLSSPEVLGMSGEAVQGLTGLGKTASRAVAEAMDNINDKYGEFVITPALMMGMDDTIIDRIAFGGVKELEELYQQ